MFARISALLLIISYLLLATPVYAQNASNPSTPKESKPTFEVSQVNSSPAPYTLYPVPSYVSPTSPLYTDLFVHNMFHSFSCLAIGQSVIGQPCLSYQITKNAQGMVRSIPVLSQANLSGGALGTVNSVITALYTNPPVRTTDYLASVGQGLGIIKEANAQVVGSGAQVLNPVIKLWQVSRNTSYVLMIIIFLVIGLMVMFRNKLNPQTVITAQAALPGLVIGLVMITFSYFFAGLLSDMAFIGTNVVGYYFVSAQGKLNDPTFNDQLNLSQKISDNSIMDIIAPMTGVVTRERAENIAQSIIGKMGDAIRPIQIVVFWVTAQFIMPFAQVIPPPLGLLIGPLASLGVGALANLALPELLGYFLSFAAALALTYQMIKLLFRLITAYLTIIFLTITAPFQFLVASLPGRQGMATGWMLSLLANILIFPAVVAVIYFVAFLLGPTEFEPHCPKDASGTTCLFNVSGLRSERGNNGGLVSPVYAQGANEIIGTKHFPLLGGMDLSFVKIILAFGALMALPTIPDIVTKSIGKGGQAGAAIGQEIMGGFNQGQGYAKRTYMAGVGWGQTSQKDIFGESGQAVWNPNKRDAAGNIVGGFDFPRRPGYIQARRRP